MCWFPAETELSDTKLSHKTSHGHSPIATAAGVTTEECPLLSASEVSHLELTCSSWARCGGYFRGVAEVRKRRWSWYLLVAGPHHCSQDLGSWLAQYPGVAGILRSGKGGTYIQASG